MKLGIIIYSHDPETVWNAFRLGVVSAKKADTVKVFLLGKGVECQALMMDDMPFPVTEVMKEFVDAGGEVLACDTCLAFRESEGLEMCSVFTIEDLYEVVSGVDRVVSF